MKFGFNILILILVASKLCNCKSIHNAKYSGEAIERISTFWETNNGKDTSYTVLNEKVWYKDSMGITQVCGIFSEEENNNQINTIKILKYRFFNLRKKWIYEYSNLSDSAKLIRKFRNSDTSQFSGGWDFAKHTSFAIDSFQNLSDTIINNVNYKQCKVSYIFNQTRFEGQGRARCDKKSTVFKIDDQISTNIGCPLVYFRLFPINTPNNGFDLNIKYLSNVIPDSVNKLFILWGKTE